MDNTELIVEKLKKTKKKKYISSADWFIKIKIAFNNASLPTIYPHLLTVGYNEAKLESFRGKLAQLTSFDQHQIKARADKIGATDALDKKRREINPLYLQHRSLLKVLLGGNTLASVSMKLSGKRKKSFSEWFQDVNSFYTQLTQTPELAAHAASLGITPAVVDVQKQLLTELQALKETQRKKIAEARTATETRNKAFDELRQLYAEYIKYARILLAGNQALEAIGITVKSR